MLTYGEGVGLTTVKLSGLFLSSLESSFLPASSSVHMYTFIHYTYVQVAIIRPLCIPYMAIVNIVLYMKSSSTANACMGK